MNELLGATLAAQVEALNMRNCPVSLLFGGFWSGDDPDPVANLREFQYEHRAVRGIPILFDIERHPCAGNPIIIGSNLGHGAPADDAIQGHARIELHV